MIAPDWKFRQDTDFLGVRYDVLRNGEDIGTIRHRTFDVGYRFQSYGDLAYVSMTISGLMDIVKKSNHPFLTLKEYKAFVKREHERKKNVG